MTSSPPRALLALLALALTATACAGDGEPAATPTTVPVPDVGGSATAPPPAPTATPTATTSAEPTASAAATAREADVTYHLLREAADGIWVEPVTEVGTVVGQGVAQAAYEALLDAQAPDDLVDPVPEGTRLLGIDVDADGLLTVDLSEELLEFTGGAAVEEAFQQALVHTGAQFPTVERVQVLVGGDAVETVGGHLDWAQPVEPDPFAISPIVVEQSTGQDGTIRVAGTSNTFEATIDVVVTGPDGSVVEEDFITATCGTGCRGDWDYALQGLDPGTYEVALTEPDPSGGEGPPPFTTTVSVRVP